MGIFGGTQTSDSPQRNISCWSYWIPFKHTAGGFALSEDVSECVTDEGEWVTGETECLNHESQKILKNQHGANKEIQGLF